MPQVRRLGATLALVAAMVMVFSSVAAAHPGHHRFGPQGFDSLWIGSHNADVYTAAEGNRDRIIGRSGSDVLDAGNKRDVVRGGRGHDAIEGGLGSDRLYGGPGNDRISGGDGPDLIIGGYGADGINGGDGHDLIKSGPGDDIIIATDGVRDWIICGRGKDAVKADKVDRVHKSCERVVRVAAD